MSIPLNCNIYIAARADFIAVLGGDPGAPLAEVSVPGNVMSLIPLGNADDFHWNPPEDFSAIAGFDLSTETVIGACVQQATGDVIFLTASISDLESVGWQ